MSEVFASEDGHRFQVVKGLLEADDVELLGQVIDRVEQWDRGQELGPWETSTRPGIGLRAWAPGTRWSHSLRSTWGDER
jgi:hypothetical protein